VYKAADPWQTKEQSSPPKKRNRAKELEPVQIMNKPRLAGLRLFQKQLRLWLLRWSGFSGGVGAVLENVWQNSFTC